MNFKIIKDKLVEFFGNDKDSLEFLKNNQGYFEVYSKDQLIISGANDLCYDYINNIKYQNETQKVDKKIEDLENKLNDIKNNKKAKEYFMLMVLACGIFSGINDLYLPLAFVYISALITIVDYVRMIVQEKKMNNSKQEGFIEKENIEDEYEKNKEIIYEIKNQKNMSLNKKEIVNNEIHKDLEIHNNYLIKDKVKIKKI